MESCQGNHGVVFTDDYFLCWPFIKKTNQSMFGDFNFPCQHLEIMKVLLFVSKETSKKWAHQRKILKK